MMMGGDGRGGGDGEGDPMSGRLGILMGQVDMVGPSTTPTHHHQQQQQQGMGMGGGGLGKGGELIRLPQWGQQETRDLISARAELERDFGGGGAAKKRSNKTLWEAVAAKMRERGHMRRTPEQCKCKWKNLVNRYKGKETDPESGRQCPFFEELHAVFTERARNMQRLLQETEPGGSQSRKKKRLAGDKSSDEFSEEDDENDEDSDEERPTRSKKKKVERGGQQQKVADRSKMGNASSIHDVLQDFFQQQQRMELKWHEMMERRAQERQRFEQEWRQSMEKLERERLMLEQVWREREEQRRMREESRAEKRDALLTTLLNKLIQEEGLQ